MLELSADYELDKNKAHDIDIVIDRIVVKPEARSRLFDSFEAACWLLEGYANVDVFGGDTCCFLEHLLAPIAGFTIGEMEPRLFLFKLPFGAAPECDGLGVKLTVDMDLVVPDPSMTLAVGLLLPWNPISR